MISIGVSIMVTTTEDAVKVMDVLRNPLLGLALEGYHVTQTFMPIKDDEEDETPDGYPKEM